ncbi:MAG: phosphate/phosphite/phosphonate ABC transporter substrate-binding protein [Candidatus Thiodiazotropha sp.]|jgi:phosphonate transport system substrate-binding protein
MEGIAVFFRAVVFVALTFTSTFAWSADNGTYRFGVVPQFEQRKLFSIWRPILDELEHRTGLTFMLVGSPKIPVFEQEYMGGAYDFAYMNPYHLLKAHDSQGYLPLVRDGDHVLKGILVVGKESPIQSVQALAGKRVAFPSPNALGASLLLRAELTNLHGVEVVPEYVQTHSSVYLHVALGLTEAGGGVDTTLLAQKPEIRQKLRILYETRPMVPHPICVHPRVPAAHRKKVLQALLEMGQTDKGAALLAKIPMYNPVAASLEDYTPMSAWGLGAFYVSPDQRKSGKSKGSRGKHPIGYDKSPVAGQ